MKYDGKLLSSARHRIAERKESNEAEHQRRVEEIHYKIPEIASIDSRLRQHMASLVSMTVRREPDLEQKIEDLKNENLDLQMKRAELLVEHGFPSDYLNDIYTCPICHDTGTDQGHPCRCLQEQYNREMTRELGTLLHSGKESFADFDPLLYSTEAQSNGIIPRDYMKMVYDFCRKYAESFSEESPSLLFQGNTGVGKTYLSACIARVVAEKGFSVCYDTAASALGYFESMKFSRSPEESEKASSRVDRMLSCDLMILDDLGTEMVTPMSVSALYTLVNTRLVDHKVTIISTNLPSEELASKYSPQIASRLEGEFHNLLFVGDDIRKIKKERGLQ